MKKFVITLISIAATATMPVYAGGLMANTNQSTEWVRHITRGTTLDPDAVYYNPAGTAFMDNGFHFSIGNQFVFQNRSTAITYAPFAMNGGDATKQYDGKTFAPLLPNVDLVWKHGRVSIMASLGIGGGGGKATYANGLGVFESQFAVLPLALSQLGIPTTAYSIDCNVKGYQVTYSTNLGVAVRITDWLSLAAQARFAYVTNSYNGFIGNIMINPTMPALGLGGDMVSAYQVFSQVAALPDGAIDATLKATAAQYAGMVADKQLKCSQSGWGISPVVALCFNLGGWSASAKYEFRTAIDITNKTDVDDTGLFPDGAVSGYDQPAMLTLALSKRFVDKVSLTAEYHCYFDKAKNLNLGMPLTTVPITDENGNILSKKDLVNGNTMEYALGVEWDITPRWLVSCGVQYSDFNVSDLYHSELGFQLDCLSVGIGGAFKISDKVRVNLAVCNAIFFPTTVQTTTSAGLEYKSRYSRRSTIASIGFDFKFAGKQK